VYDIASERIAIEGKFGQGKRRFSLARIMAKLAGTSEVAVMISFMVMNLERILSPAVLFFYFMHGRVFRSACKSALCVHAVYI
jgi:hypothetical protein